MILHDFISMRGMREQAFKFATGNYKGGMRGCYTRGCEIITPLGQALRGHEVSGAIRLDQMHNRECEIDPLLVFWTGSYDEYLKQKHKK
jgi:hypothetical protein